MKIHSKALNRKVTFEVEGELVFIEGVKYTKEEIKLMKEWDNQDVLEDHALRLCRRYGYTEV